MRAAVLTDTETLELRPRERPSPAPDEVLVAVREVGICGSDVHYWRHGRIGEYVVEEPLVLGHEVAGEVVGAGEAVTDLAVGDRVALEPGVPCRRCEHCTAGWYNRCPDVRFMATPPHDGALAEYVAWPADFVSRLPDAVSTREGALCEPLSIGVHAARRGGVGLGDSVLVTGCGPIGLLAADAARAAGATDVVVSDVVASKLDRARERGTDLAVDASVEAVPETVRDHTGGGVDVAVEASGSPAGIETAVASVRRGGDVVLVGLPGGDGTVPVDVLSLVDDELDVHGSFRYANTYPAAVSLFADGTVDGESLVDETFPLGSVDEAFGRAAAPETAKVVVSVA